MGETDQIIDQPGYLRGDRRHEICVMRADAAAANPDLIRAPASRNRRVLGFHQGTMHRENGCRIKVIREVNGCRHCSDIRDDGRCVALVAAAQLRKRDLLGARREVLYLRRCRRLRTQQNRRKRSDVMSELGVEAGQGQCGLRGQCGDIVGKRRGAFGDGRYDGCGVRSPVTLTLRPGSVDRRERSADRRRIRTEAPAPAAWQI